MLELRGSGHITSPRSLLIVLSHLLTLLLVLVLGSIWISNLVGDHILVHLIVLKTLRLILVAMMLIVLRLILFSILLSLIKAISSIHSLWLHGETLLNLLEIIVSNSGSFAF